MAGRGIESVRERLKNEGLLVKEGRSMYASSHKYMNRRKEIIMCIGTIYLN